MTKLAVRDLLLLKVGDEAGTSVTFVWGKKKDAATSTLARHET